MLTKFIDEVADVLATSLTETQKDKEILVFGLTTALEQVLSIIITLVLGFVLGIVFESLLFFIAFSFIRRYAGGYHCEKVVNCYISSIIVIVFALLIIRFTPSEISKIMSIVLLLITTPILLKFSPMSTKCRSIEEVEWKYYRKKTIINLIIEIIVISLLLLVNLRSFAFSICLGFFLTGISVLLQKFANNLKQP